MLETTMTVLIAVTSVLIVLFHGLSVFQRGIAARLCGFINVALHIALVAFMLVRAVSLSWLVLAFMVSLLVYVSMFAIDVKIHTGAGVKEENDDI